MKPKFKIALRIFKYVVIFYTLFFIPYMVYDDWGFWVEYGRDHWLEYIIQDFRWWLAYVLAVTIYYWIIASLIIFIAQLVTRKK
jgi:hypothetical protein